MYLLHINFLVPVSETKPNQWPWFRNPISKLLLTYCVILGKYLITTGPKFTLTCTLKIGLEKLFKPLWSLLGQGWEWQKSSLGWTPGSSFSQMILLLFVYGRLSLLSWKTPGQVVWDAPQSWHSVAFSNSISFLLTRDKDTWAVSQIGPIWWHSTSSPVWFFSPKIWAGLPSAPVSASPHAVHSSTWTFCKLPFSIQSFSIFKRL